MMPPDPPSPADISTRPAANAAVTAAELPPPGAGVAAATDSRNAASGCLLSSSIRGYRTCVATTVPQRVPFDDVSDEQVESFRRDGFLIIEEGLVSMGAVEILRGRFAALFDSDYATGIAPDEVNWKRGRDPDDVTRQICNGWRADDLIAAQVLSETTGRIAARLGGYRGTRMLQDNCLWKPPGTKSLGMHQDGSYAGYLSPPEMITCWVALDETFAQGGTIEYVRGSHLWPKAPPDRGSFHAPENWLAPLDAATPEGVEPCRTSCPSRPASTPPTPTSSTPAIAAAATSRSTNRSSPCCGTRTAAGPPGWLAYRGFPERHLDM